MGQYRTKLALRQLYIESQAAEFLKRNAKKYSLTVALSLDVVFENKISESDVARIIENGNLVMRSGNNDAGGYTDGLYVGPTHLVAKVMNRFKLEFFKASTNSRWAKVGERPHDYEQQVLWAFERNNITSEILKGHFSKKSMSKVR